MTHVDQRIQAYLDGELAAAERVSVEAHLEACPRCRQQLEATRELWDEVSAAAPAELRDPLWPGVATRLARQPARATWTWPQRGLAAAAAAAGVLIGLGLGGPIGGAGEPETATASADYLEESLPSLDQMWLQLGDADEDAGS